MNILMIGDIIGSPGRAAVKMGLARLREELRPELIVANVENLAGGFGATRETLDEEKALGVEVFTSGNHIWDKKESANLWEAYPTLLRPLNYPEGCAGRGEILFHTSSGVPVGVINLQGRVFMQPMDDPFRSAEASVARLKGQGARVILIDFHAEATSEKNALAHYLDGRATAVAGTHTHIPTADARISPAGTAFITDIGMCGSYDSVIGMKADGVMKKFLLNLPTRWETAKENPQFWGFWIQADEATGRATAVRQVHISEKG